MNELVVIVEGETEQTFVRDQLAAHLALRNITVWPVLPGRHRNRGGIKKWDVAQRDIVNTLNEGRYCSTMFDYYAMPADWPGRSDAIKKPWSERANTVEAVILTEIIRAMGARFNPKLFVPYIQLHEFEALAFADVDILASVLAPIGRASPESLAIQFRGIVDEAGSPEAINDGYETCPSRRIARLVKAYKKAAQGPIVTHRIGIDALRVACPHFGEWLTRLEQISQPSAAP